VFESVSFGRALAVLVVLKAAVTGRSLAGYVGYAYLSASWHEVGIYLTVLEHGPRSLTCARVVGLDRHRSTMKVKLIEFHRSSCQLHSIGNGEAQ